MNSKLLTIIRTRNHYHAMLAKIEILIINKEILNHMQLHISVGGPEEPQVVCAGRAGEQTVGDARRGWDANP